MEKVSVVIATLGGRQLIETVAALNSGSIVPEEILICIPESQVVETSFLIADNIRIIRTAVRGQVAQRAIGFTEVRNELVLQLDDDILVEKNAIQHMVNYIRQSPMFAVGPKLIDKLTGSYQSYLVPISGKPSWYEKFQFLLINGTKGFDPGGIGKAGVCMGVPDDEKDWEGLDWLPGGCVLHHKNNLVLYNFYPFAGKAYAEDLFHSICLRKKNVILVRCASAVCFLNNAFAPPIGAAQFVREQKRSTNALKSVVAEIHGSRWRLYGFMLLNSGRLIFSKIFKR